MPLLKSLHASAESLLGPRLFKLIRYLTSGGMAMLTNLGSLFVLVNYFGLHYLSSSVIAFVISITVSFSMQKFWTFQDHPIQDIRAQFTRYLAVILTNLTLNTAIVYVLAEKFAIWYLLAQLIAGIVIAFTGYFAYKHLVFKERSTANS